MSVRDNSPAEAADKIPPGKFGWYDVNKEQIYLRGGIYTTDDALKLQQELHDAVMAIWQHLIAKNAAKEAK